MEKEEKKKLNIIVLADDSDYGTSALRYGGILAAIFQASLTIVSDFSFSNISSKTNHKLNDEQLKLSQQFIDNQIEVIVVSDKYTPENIYVFADEVNTIMFVIGVQKQGKGSLFDLRSAKRFIKPSRLPVMTVGLKLPSSDIFRHVMLPLDIERQQKEKSLWAGYFSRFYHSQVHVLFSSYKDAFLRKKVKDNVDFTKKLYQNLEITYELHHLEDEIDNIDRFSLEFASTINATLSVIMMTHYYSLIDRLFGPKEDAMIANEQEIPILCINERDDLYVLCT